MAAEIELARLEQGAIGDHAHHFAAGDGQTAFGGQPPGLFQHHVRRGDVVIRQVDRDLRPAVLIDVPADRLAEGELSGAADLAADDLGGVGKILAGLGRQLAQLVAVGLAAMGLDLGEGFAGEVAVAAGKMPFPIEEDFTPVIEGRIGLGAGHAAFQAQLEGDVRGRGFVAGVQRDVVGDEELAGADGRGAGLGVEPRRPGVRLPTGIGQFLRQPFVLALADVGQICPLGRRGRRLVEIDGNRQFLADPPADLPGDLGAVLHRHALDRDEGAHVGRAHPGMRAVVPAHVEHLRRLGDGLEGRFGDRLGRADEGDHRAVGVPAGVHVQQFDALDGLDGIGDLLDFGRVFSFREIGHALDDFPRHRKVLGYSRAEKQTNMELSCGRAGQAARSPAGSHVDFGGLAA